jgi:methionine synthase I (cobalamin-dependent)
MASDAFAVLSRRLLSGRPLLLGGDVGASLRARGVSLSGPGALGRLVREHPDEVDRHYAVEIEAGVDVLTTLTSDTTPRALAQVGMAFRAAAITSAAVDRAVSVAEMAGRPVAVAGVLGGSPVAPLDVATLVEEHGIHAARLAASGAGLILARGMASRTELMAAVVAAANTDVPTWAVVEAEPDGTVLGGDSPAQVVRLLETAGASAILFEASSTGAAREAVARARSGGVTLPFGVLLDAGPSCLEGYPEGALSPEAWAEAIFSLLPFELRAVGGGRGCTEAHTAALARFLREQPSLAIGSDRPTAESPC